MAALPSVVKGVPDSGPVVFTRPPFLSPFEDTEG